ncbi:MAG: P-II family nitrogen regulator [Nitrososphaerales archaeon]
MKKVEALIKHDILDGILSELKKISTHITLQEVTYVGKTLEQVNLSSVIVYNKDRVGRVKIEIFAQDEQVDNIITVIKDKIKMRKEEEYIAIVNVDRMLSFT